MADETFSQEMGIEPINAPATSLEPVFQSDATNSLVMESLVETHKPPEPYSDVDKLADELETAIINLLL